MRPQPRGPRGRRYGCSSGLASPSARDSWLSAGGRSPGFRALPSAPSQGAWLPSGLVRQVHPVTVAGPRRFRTGLPLTTDRLSAAGYPRAACVRQGAVYRLRLRLEIDTTAASSTAAATAMALATAVAAVWRSANEAICCALLAATSTAITAATSPILASVAADGAGSAARAAWRTVPASGHRAFTARRAAKVARPQAVALR